MLDEHREYIEIQIAKELSIVRIHQDIQRERGVECGYSTLRDYVRKLMNITPHPYMVLHSLPGEEAQIDFGYIGTVVVAGRRKKAGVIPQYTKAQKEYLAAPRAGRGGPSPCRSIHGGYCNSSRR